MAKARTLGIRKKIESWPEIMSAWSRSDLSQAAFCEKQGIPFSTFQYWRYQRMVRGNDPFHEVENPAVTAFGEMSPTVTNPPSNTPQTAQYRGDLYVTMISFHIQRDDVSP